MSWEIDTAKMWSLGHFTVPTPFDSDTLLRWLRKRVETRHVLVRHPGHEQSMFNTYDESCANYDPWDDVTLWHQDGVEMGHEYLGVWSNMFSTEVRIKGSRSRTIYQAEPGEFVLIHNKFFEHRCPIGLTKKQMKSRWFARFDTSGPVLDHPDVRECQLTF